MDWVVQLAELAFDTGDFAELEQWDGELRKLEGPDGLVWQYLETRRLLAQAKDLDDAELAEASALQTRISSQRPAWPKTHLLEGLVCGDARQV